MRIRYKNGKDRLIKKNIYDLKNYADIYEINNVGNCTVLKNLNNSNNHIAIKFKEKNISIILIDNFITSDSLYIIHTCNLKSLFLNNCNFNKLRFNYINSSCDTLLIKNSKINRIELAYGVIVKELCLIDSNKRSIVKHNCLNKDFDLRAQYIK